MGVIGDNGEPYTINSAMTEPASWRQASAHRSVMGCSLSQATGQATKKVSGLRSKP